MIPTTKPEPDGGSTEKVCPICLETIPMAAVECPCCKTRFGDTRPISREDLFGPNEDSLATRYQRGAVLLLMISLLGVTSPLTLLLAAYYYRKQELRRATSPVRVLLVISIVISAIYIFGFVFGSAMFLSKTSAMQSKTSETGADRVGGKSGPSDSKADFSPPTVLIRVEPQYSEEARKAQRQGTVIVEVTVRQNGTVEIGRVVRGLGFGLDERAIQALQQWRFKPGMLNGVPVDVSVEVEVNFNLR